MKFFNLYFNGDINSELLEKRKMGQNSKNAISKNPTKYWMGINSQAFSQFSKPSEKAVLYPLADYYKNHKFTINSQIFTNPCEAKNPIFRRFCLKNSIIHIHFLENIFEFLKFQSFVNYSKNKNTEPTKKPISNVLLFCEFIVNLL